MSENQVAKREKQEVATREQRRPTFAPRVDIYEDEKTVTLLADMPGVDENNVEIDLERNVLTIRGRSGIEYPGEAKLAYREYADADYERVFTIGQTIDRDGIEARVKDGVLRLHLPKVPEAQARRIQVTAG
jgi:HSP20 family protein